MPFLLLILALIVSGGVLYFLFWMGWWVTNRTGGVSPYGGETLLKGTELSFPAIQKVHDFMSRFGAIENPAIDFLRASVCRRTGRVFPNTITIFGVISVGKNYLKKRYPGKYVEWSSLSDEQKEAVFLAHGTLEGFKIVNSDGDKPGPLYVDMTKKHVMGWQCVPDTILEVMIVQKPLMSSERKS